MTRLQNNKVRNQHFYYLYARHNKTTQLLLSPRASVPQTKRTNRSPQECLFIYKYFKCKLRFKNGSSGIGSSPRQLFICIRVFKNTKAHWYSALKNSCFNTWEMLVICIVLVWFILTSRNKFWTCVNVTLPPWRDATRSACINAIRKAVIFGFLGSSLLFKNDIMNSLVWEVLE